MKGRGNVSSTAKTNWKQIGSNVKDVFRSPAFFVPVVISIVLLTVFFLRRFIRWTVKCPSKNDLDGKTVLITGELSCFFVFLWIKTILHGRGKMCGCFIGLGLWRLTPLSTLFQLYRYIVAVSVIGGGNRNTRKKPPTCRKSLDVLYYCLKLANFILSFSY